jgi:uncharacterized protein GlcG (DUF336 family)
VIGASCALVSAFRILPLPGGLPIEEDREVVAGIGAGGPPPEVCEDIARSVIVAR